MKYTSVNTHQLAVGNIVACHGSKFRLVDRFSSPGLPNDNVGGDCVWFTTEYLGPVGLPDHEIMPKHWRNDWSIQGNRRAGWKVIDSLSLETA